MFFLTNVKKSDTLNKKKKTLKRRSTVVLGFSERRWQLKIFIPTAGSSLGVRSDCDKKLMRGSPVTEKRHGGAGRVQSSF